MLKYNIINNYNKWKLKKAFFAIYSFSIHLQQFFDPWGSGIVPPMSMTGLPLLGPPAPEPEPSGNVFCETIR